jgi:cytoskeleton protein RodZ
MARKRPRLKFMAGGGGEPETAEATPRLSVGAALRAERERRGLTVDDVAANLRIRRALIDAIEHGRYKELPGAPYAVGFIRTYSEFLELDREEMIRRFHGEAKGLEDRKELNFPKPLPESRLPGGVLLLMSAVIAAVAYAFWHFHSSEDRAPVPRVAAVPEQLAPLAQPAPAPRPDPVQIQSAPVPAPAETTTSEAAQAAETRVRAEPPSTEQAAATPAPTATPTSEPAPATSVATAPPTAPVTTPSSATETTAIPTAPTDSSAPRVFGESSGHRIVIRATADSWVQVRDAGGTVVFTRVLRPGDSYNVPDRSGLSLYTGSAGALEFTVDGKIAPSVGQPGTVRRDVMLDPDRLLAGTAVLDQKRPSSASEPRPAASPASGTPVSGG